MKVLALNVFVLSGIGLIVYGTWRIYEPAAFLLAGAGMLVIASGLNRQSKAK